MLRDYPGSLVLYHVTIAEHVRPITLEGIRPDCAVGKMKASWYVSLRNIEWAGIHVLQQKIAQPDDLFVCATLVEANDMYKFFRPGFYYTFTTYHPESITPFMFFIHNEGRFNFD